MDRAGSQAGLDADSVTSLKGVGPRKADQLARLGISSAQDLLFHLPLHYQDRTRVVPMGSLRAGVAAVVQGEVELSEVRQGRRRSLLCRISDGTGALVLRFFYFSARQQAGLARGVRLRCFGEVRSGPNGLEMVHPEYRELTGDGLVPVEQYLTPVYPTTEGLQQRTLRTLCSQALERLESGVGAQELLPPPVLERLRYPPLEPALRYLHRPPPDAPLADLEGGRHPVQRRLVFEELLAHHLSLRQLRQRLRARPAPALAGDGVLIREFLAALPFPLTAAQHRVIEEIREDLALTHPMLRLVQGDVGSGKTVVAAAAALQAIASGFQVAVMAPTELLAEQHQRSFREWFAPLALEAAWLTSKTKGKARQQTLEAIRSGVASVVVGTHALFQQDVEFSDLGLVIVDEQHRFGVHQRLALREKGATKGRYPHQLIMTATPIPRTLAMTAYADLDCSVIDELPPGRTPVQTVVIPDTRREEVIARVRAAVAEGRQAYWVCTLVEESEVLQCEAAAATATLLSQTFDGLPIGLVHGRMKAADKEQIMAQFKAAELQLLVATTVIEVGVDVPNASLMVIENAERLGLAQLHQLRGRVGRGGAQSHCVLMYHPPLSAAARARLATVRETTDGFQIARQDLELRGPGEVLGTRQTGLAQLRIADLVRDQDLFPAVEWAAKLILRDYPAHVASLVRRWLGDGAQYGDV